MKRLSIIVLAAALGVSGASRAAVTVLGGGEAEACYLAAKAGRADPLSLASCDQALASEELPMHDRGGTYVNRGVMRLIRGEYQAARGDLEAGVALIPDVGEAWSNRGAMYVGVGRFREAVSDLDKALSLGVKEPAKVYFNRALAYEGLDDETSAYRDYQQALVLAPEWEAPKRELQRFTVTSKP